MNVIVVLLDTIRKDFLSCYNPDTHVQTPAIDALASKGVVFDHAYIGSYPCMPARRDLWTGRYEFPYRGWGPLEEHDTTLPDKAGRNGNRAALITDHFHLWERGSGNYHMAFSAVEFIRGQEKDTWIQDDRIDVEWPAAPSKLAGHFRNPEEAFKQYARNTAHFRNEEDYFGPQVMRKAMNWLEGNYQTKDFLLMIDNFDPHEPFDVPEPYRSMYNPKHGSERIIWPNYGETDLSEEEIHDVRSLYAGLLTMTDRWVGLLFDKVRQLGIWDDTVIVLMTDHGHLFGEHGLMGKPWSGLSDSNLYKELAHIPLIIHHPKVQPHRVSSLVQIVDLYPTILEILDIPYDKGNIHGRSLLPQIQSNIEPPDWRSVALFGRFGEALNVTDGEWTLMQWYDRNWEGDTYWYSHHAPLFSENVRLVGELQDNCRYPVQVTRGVSESRLFHDTSDPSQENDLFQTLDGSIQAKRLKDEARRVLEQINAPHELIGKYGL